MHTYTLIYSGMQELAQQQAAARTAEAAGARSRGEGAGSSRDAQSIVSIAAARRTIKPTALQVYASIEV
jgi:hypothetical protein